MEALLIAGAVTSAVSAISQGNAARKQGEYNAAVATRNAGVARDQANADAAAQSRVARQRMGAARAAVGASGIGAEGSPLDVLAMSASNAELDRQNILYKGQLRALGYEDTAALEESRGKAAQKAGYVKAASSLLMGGAQAYGAMPKPATGNKLSFYDDPGF